MHSLLQRQIRRHLGSDRAIPPEWEALLRAVSEAYAQADADRRLLEHSMEVVSQELMEMNQRLRDDAAARRRLEERYRSLVEASAQIVWDQSPAGEFVGEQPGWSAFTGQGRQEYLGRGWLDAVHPEDREALRAAWAEAVSRREPVELEHRLHRHDGEYRYMLMRAVPVLEQDGGVREWIGTHGDITERKRAEAERERLLRALEAEQTRLQTVFVETPAAIALYHGPEHVVTMVNPVWERLTGRSGVVGRTFAEVFPELADSELIELLHRVYVTGEAYVGNESRVLLNRKGDGELEETFWNFVWQPLYGTDGTVTDILVHAVEVTDQVRARQRVEEQAQVLARVARALEISNRELDRFAYVASHDLKAPLRGIANLSAWIEEDLGERVTEEAREHLELLRGRVLRLEGLIDGILQYSRAGRQRAEPEEVDVGALLREVIDLLGVEGASVEIGPGMPRLVTERLPLQQVFQNLLSNAVKYAVPHGGVVRLHARDADDFWEFTVSDDGPGISPEYHDRIFELFQRLESRDEIEGSGVGLALVKKIVEACGGQIWVESEQGVGSTFRFLWPKDLTGVESQSLAVSM